MKANKIIIACVVMVASAFTVWVVQAQTGCVKAETSSGVCGANKVMACAACISITCPTDSHCTSGATWQIGRASCRERV